MSRIMSTWLYQFWLFSYETAKHWGRGPRDWTADLLDLDKHLEKLTISSPNTPGMIAESPAPAATIQSQNHTGSMMMDGTTPTILCQWGVHLHRPEGIDSPPPLDDIEDLPDKGADWPKSWHRLSFLEKLRNGLESNDF